jgi:urea transport system permease protein
MDLFMLQVFNGISVGSILLLVALGLVLSFGLMGVINMAHGELIMAGAYSAYVIQSGAARVGGGTPAWPSYLVSVVVAFFVAAAIGLALEASLIRHLYRRPLDTLLATWGVGLVLQQFARSVFGAPNVQVPSPEWLSGGVPVFGALVLSYKRLFILALAVVALTGIWAYMQRTSAGRRIRAVMQDRDMAECLGVATRRVDAGTFAIGSGLAGVAGAAIALLGPVGPALGTYYVVDAFMVVIVGGAGQILGATFAALGIGGLNMAFELGSTASLGKVAVLITVIAFLQWRPSGLIARRARG